MDLRFRLPKKPPFGEMIFSAPDPGVMETCVPSASRWGTVRDDKLQPTSDPPLTLSLKAKDQGRGIGQGDAGGRVNN
jgi:hypothetical protein